ncbi:ferredoxin [Conexibacter woesei]|uniref:Ferredoxin n=1 Tax=Conexibacter woesei (strain DSM 14684 / CCUG 47730 / CIP 108061 / JCM 11494 / NBRC 100937 / ID131577) TaxID=469383 RepID=D3F399_CONWI|nr:ferredoxin [Conexibacter woesei]ADB50379.1 protein of unknown function DUF1271 [Conexibacter woesei DSM 14684]
MRIEIDYELCVASGMCALIAPDLFEQNLDDGRAVVPAGELAAERLEAARRVVGLCPSAALSLTGDDA